MLTLREGAITRIYVIEQASHVRLDHALYSTEDEMSMERECQEVVYALVRALKPELVIEVGSWKGSTAEVIGNALEDNGHGRLVSIEIDPVLANLARIRCAHLRRVEIVDGDATALAANYDRVDMLIVDGGGHRGLEQDAFAGRLSPGALIVRHDVLKDSPWDGGDLTLRTPRGLALSLSA